MTDVAPETSLALYRIPQANMPGLESLIARIAKKAAKLNSGEIIFRTIATEAVKYQDADGFERVRTFHMVEVGGPTPRINGWAFIATLAHTAEGVIVCEVPGTTQEGELIPYRTVKAVCDHCGKARNRIDTYVLRSDAGAYKQVGSSCLRDFLGHANPGDLASMAEYLADAGRLAGGAEDEGWGMGGSGRGEDDWSTEGFVSMTAAVIRRFGFVSKGKSEEMGRPSTSLETQDVYTANYKHGCNTDGGYCADMKCQYARRGGHVAVTDADVTKGEAALAWIRAMDREGLGDYLYSLHVACAGEAVNRRQYGLVASLVSAYDRATEEATEKAAAPILTNEWIGTPGVRQQIMGLIVKKVIANETQYGVTMIHKFEDAEGRAYTWFCSGEPFEEGVTVNVDATVKAHDEYRGRKQTILTRVSETLTPAQIALGKATKKAVKAIERTGCYTIQDRIDLCNADSIETLNAILARILAEAEAA